MGQRRQQMRRGGRPWPIVERQHHLVIVKRQRLWKAFEPDPWRGGGIDLQNAGGAERDYPGADSPPPAPPRHSTPSSQRHDKAGPASIFMSIPGP
jgi:hypothetical protein